MIFDERERKLVTRLAFLRVEGQRRFERRDGAAGVSRPSIKRAERAVALDAGARYGRLK